MSFVERARAVLRGELRVDEPLARHTTLRVGGPADWFALPADVADVQALRALAAEEGVPCHVVGSGSNLLVLDGGVRGLVLSLERLRGIDRRAETILHVEAGVATGKVLASAMDHQLGGVEFLAGVPGTVGGGVIMNAGTYLGEFKNVTREVRSVDAGGALVTRSGEDCGFVYRGSAIPASDIVVDVVLELQPRRRADIEEDVRGMKERRRGREPRGMAGSAGSFFKNPPGDHAGRLIEAAALKGRRIGGAEVSQVHANWLINAGAATAADFTALIEVVRSEVQQQLGVRLELEVRIVGEAAPARGIA